MLKNHEATKRLSKVIFLTIMTEGIGRSRIVHGRIIMFTDGKSTSTTERPTIVEDNITDLESEVTVKFVKQTYIVLVSFL